LGYGAKTAPNPTYTPCAKQNVNLTSHKRSYIMMNEAYQTALIIVFFIVIVMLQLFGGALSGQ